MAFALRATPHFQRALVRLRRQRPELDRRLDQTLRDLSEDPHQPHLRLHALHGDLEGSHAVRVTYAYHILDHSYHFRDGGMAVSSDG